jgi:hypothetical protein
MSAWLVLIVGVLYAGVAVDQALKGNWPDVLIWGAYCVSNLGFLWRYLQQ